MITYLYSRVTHLVLPYRALKLQCSSNDFEVQDFQSFLGCIETSASLLRLLLLLLAPQ